MPTEPAFMPWIDKLHEVGEPIRRRRAELEELAREAAELEWHAASLRTKLAEGEAELLQAVMRHWTLADIQAAAEAVRCADPLTPAREQINDTALRGAVARLDGWQLASEALRVFHDAGVLRQHNLLSSATDDERLQALERVLTWWNWIARPVYDRFTSKQRRAGQSAARCVG